MHVIEATGPDGARLRVRLDRTQDRYAHSLELVRAADVMPLWTSIESTPNDTWPSSPALQQLSIEQRGAHQIALLVGMAGQNHWSLSIEPRENAAAMIFDVACRLRQPPVQIGSRYQALGVPDRLAVVEMIPSARPHATTLSQRGNHWTLVPANLPASYPATVRWKYEIRG